MIFLVLFLCFIPQYIFAEEDLNSYENLKLNVTNSIKFSLTHENEFRVNTFVLDSFTYPQYFNGAQTLNSFTTSKKEYEIKEKSAIKYIEFSYDANNLKQNNVITNSFLIESTTYRPKISHKVKYPIKNIDPKLYIYLEHGGLIDIDEKIAQQASQIAQGEDDTFIIASKVAKWIREDINYDLSTVTLNPNQKSTEVFKSKKGVCREITNLYISMLRSLGIPSRVVTGYAYTTSEEVVDFVGSNWGGHAWAEVYIGGVWVPFDLTYDQYGYVDSSHIILDKSSHLRTTSATINATGYGFSLTPKSLKVKNTFDILDKKNKGLDLGFKVNINGPNKLGFGSYGYLEVEIENAKNYYQILFLNLAKTKEIKTFDNEERMIIFKPNEKKTIYYRYKIPNELLSDYVYTFPFSVYNNFLRKSYNVSVAKTFSKIEKSSLPEETKKTASYTSNPMKFNCNFLFDLPENKILCSVKNTNNFIVSDFRVCLNLNCKSLVLNINGEETFSFLTTNQSVNLNYNYKNVSGNFSLNLIKPKLSISTKKIDKIYYIDYTVEDFIEGNSVEIIRNSQLVKRVDSSKLSNQVLLEEGENNITIDLKYKDEILEEQNFNVYLAPKLNFFEKILEWVIILLK